VVEESWNNEFLRTVELEISRDEFKYRRECVAQIDIASPISLLKSKFILSDQIATVKDVRYEELNESVLEILRQIETKVFGKEISANAIVFRVVPDYAIKCDIRKR